MKKNPPIVADSRDATQLSVDRRPPEPLVGAEFETAAAEPQQLPPAGAPEIAFAGRSNSGKSSAINALARRTRLAFSSRTPGRTQQINFFRLRSGAVVTDLPGYGYAAVPHALKRGWQALLWDYVTTRGTLIAMVLLVDSRHGLRPQDEDLLAGFLPSGRPVLILATKVDKLNQSQRSEAVRAIVARLGHVFPMQAAAVSVVAFSATSRLGVAEADAALARWLDL
jgi:GTP-binding protein